jgi:bifunctional enzyme CysN/CysC
MRRDPKGLYPRARRGGLANMTGIDSPYEPPEQAELVLDTAAVTAAAERVMALLAARGITPAAVTAP